MDLNNYVFAISAAVIIFFFLWIIMRYRRENFYQSCGGSCKTDANCAEGMKCNNGKCCI